MRRTPSVSSASRRRLLVRSSRQTPCQLVVERIVSSGSTNTVAPLCDRSWMMPRTPRRGVVADRNHVAAVPDGDVALLERRLDGRVIEETLDARLEIGPERRDLAPQRAEPRAGAIRQPAVGVERVVERRGEVGELGKSGPRTGEAGRHGPDALAIRPEPGGGREPAPSATSAGPSRTAPGGAASARIGRASPAPSQGGGPSAVRARRASVVSWSVLCTAWRAGCGISARARSRPGWRAREAREEVTKGLPAQEVVADQHHLDRPKP